MLGFPGSFSILEQDIKYAQVDPSLFWVQGMHARIGLGIHVNDFIIAHAINALTNPFSFLVRSFQMTSLLISMMFLPLVAMGLESCLYLWDSQPGHTF